MPYRTRCFPLSQYNSLHWLFPGSSRFCTHTGSSFISHSSSNVSGSLLGCGMVSILSISSLKSAYVAAHDTGAVSLFQVSKIRLLYSSCNISASIGLILNLSIHASAAVWTIIITKNNHCITFTTLVKIFILNPSPVPHLCAWAAGSFRTISNVDPGRTSARLVSSYPRFFKSCALSMYSFIPFPSVVRPQFPKSRMYDLMALHSVFQSPP